MSGCGAAAGVASHPSATTSNVHSGPSIRLPAASIAVTCQLVMPACGLKVYDPCSSAATGLPLTRSSTAAGLHANCQRKVTVLSLMLLLSGGLTLVGEASPQLVAVAPGGHAPTS